MHSAPSLRALLMRLLTPLRAISSSGRGFNMAAANRRGRRFEPTDAQAHGTGNFDAQLAGDHRRPGAKKAGKRRLFGMADGNDQPAARRPSAALGRAPLAEAFSIQRLMRLASPMRVSLPQESSSTMTTGRLLSQACMTRHLPASRM